MNFLDNPKIKDDLVGKMANLIFQYTDNAPGHMKAGKIPDLWNRLKEHVSSNLPEDIKEAINVMPEEDQKYYLSPEVTVEVTTKKKGKIIAADWFAQDLIGKIIPLAKAVKEKAYYKQVLAGPYMDGEFSYSVNTKPKKFCCHTMQQQFNFCDQHGMNCVDYFVRYTDRTGYHVEAVNATYAINNCPFCGTKLAEEKGNNTNRIIKLG